jgi:hypothetical protein
MYATLGTLISGRAWEPAWDQTCWKKMCRPHVVSRFLKPSSCRYIQHIPASVRSINHRRPGHKPPYISFGAHCKTQWPSDATWLVPSLGRSVMKVPPSGHETRLEDPPLEDDLVGGAMCSSWKMMDFVNGKNSPIYEMENKNGWNHQPVILHQNHWRPPFLLGISSEQCLMTPEAAL